MDFHDCFIPKTAQALSGIKQTHPVSPHWIESKQGFGELGNCQS